MNSPRFALLAVTAICLVTGRAVCIGEDYVPPHMDHVANLIRDEGMNSSQVMETLTYLTDVIGPRLTASPNHKRANEWTRDKMASWGLTNAHLEAFGPFGKGWSLRRFSAQVVEPQAFPLIAYPAAWSPGLYQPITGDVVYLNATNKEDMARFKGKLKGAIVLISRVRETRPRFDALATRMTEADLLQLANAGRESPRTYGYRGRSSASGPTNAPSERSTPDGLRTNSVPPRLARTGESASTNAQTARATAPYRLSPRDVLRFLIDEGAAVAVSSSPMGDGGTVFVAAAMVPAAAQSQTTNSAGSGEILRPWSTNAFDNIPQVTVATEDYNRLVRVLEKGEKLKMAVDLQCEFQTQDTMAYNTIAEIPGSDLKDEIVMVGGHLDSWHTGTGATDNAIGVAVAMEAVRIIKALKLTPRRTIRAGLWAGEEQGLLGSKAYVAQHFGYYTNKTEPQPSVTKVALRAPKDARTERPAASSSTSRSGRQLVRLPEYEKFSAYFNLDNGAGRIRGIHLQGNEATRPYFSRWLEPFRDLDASTVSLSNTRGTDHLSFDTIGLPGFQFIQDTLDYNSRTHHSNQDVADRIVPEDAKQAAVILATFLYNAASIDERLPRKSVE